jgi:hypothetical protein
MPEDILTDKIIKALGAVGPVRSELLWMIADDLCRDISTLKGCLLTKKPAFCMVQLDEMQDRAYKLRNHLKRDKPEPTG